MKNTYTTPADFWKVRDFGTKISAVFEFLQAHWRPLGKCLVYFVVPASLVMGIGMGLYTNTLYDRMGEQLAKGSSKIGIVPGGDNIFNFSGFAIFMLGGGLAFLLLLSTVYGYLRARLQLPASQPITPALVWAEIRGRLGKMGLTLLVFTGAYLAIMLVVGGTFTAAAYLFKSTGGLGILLMMGLTFLLFFALAYLGPVVALYLPVLWLEDRSVLQAIRRSFQLIKGNWWATLGLLLVVSFIQGAMSIVFLIPLYASIFGKMLHLPLLSSDLVGLLCTSFYSVGTLLAYPVLLLATAFQYFNLVEQREGHGLRLLINDLGQAQAAPVAFSHHYRPEEEQY